MVGVELVLNVQVVVEDCVWWASKKSRRSRWMYRNYIFKMSGGLDLIDANFFR